jgi:hypothetical protein
MVILGEQRGVLDKAVECINRFFEIIHGFVQHFHRLLVMGYIARFVGRQQGGLCRFDFLSAFAPEYFEHRVLGQRFQTLDIFKQLLVVLQFCLFAFFDLGRGLFSFLPGDFAVLFSGVFCLVRS